MNIPPGEVSVSRLPVLLLILCAAACGTGEGPPPGDLPSPPPAIAPYVDHLRAGVEDPVDYVLDLFDSRDLVILCERWHPEATQYDFFWEVVSDPRFVDRVGRVFTELGSRNLQEDLDRLMASTDLDEAAVRAGLLPIYRDLVIHPGWDNTNFFEFLVRVHGLNRTLPAGQRVEVLFSDLELHWKEMSPEAFQEFRETVLPERDRRMADAIIDGVRAADAAGAGLSKALVIMNFRHAFNDFTFEDGSRGDNVGRYLFEAFPGRVANVMLNAVALLPGTTDSEAVYEPLQKGKWDAAFRFAAIEEGAFDFAGTPFGQDGFDFFSFRPHSRTYEEVFTGFVFWRPLAEHRMVTGIPGLFDGFAEEYRRRIEVVGSEVDEEALEAAMAASASPVSEGYGELQRLESMIAEWLEPEG
jgi:hypothetical protein